MKKLMLLILMVASIGAQAQNPVPTPGTISFTTTLTSTTQSGPCISLVGSGINLHKFQWSTVGTVSAGAVKLVSSTAADCSSPSDLIAAQTVTSSGGPTSTTAGTVNYIKFTASTAIVGTGSVTIRYYGYVDRIANISGTGVMGDCVYWATATTIADAGAPCGGGGAVWGLITGDIEDQTDLQELLASIGSGGSSPAQTSFLVSGGSVVWVSAYQFSVSAATYYINGSLYTSAAATITLDPADMTDDRVDIIAVNTSGAVVKVTGTAAAQPSEPDIDPSTQLKLGIVLVDAGSSQPTGISTAVVYEDNAGPPAEWAWSTSGSGFNVNSGTNCYLASSKCIAGTAVTNGSYAKGVTATAINPNSYNQLVMYVRSVSTWANNRSLQISLRSAGVLVGTSVNLAKTGTFGFVSSTTGVYQQVGICTCQFAVPAGTTIDEVRVTDAGGAINFILDHIFFQGGATTPPVTNQITGSGTANQVTFWTDTQSLGGSSQLVFHPEGAAGTDILKLSSTPGPGQVIGLFTRLNQNAASTNLTGQLVQVTADTLPASLTNAIGVAIGLSPDVVTGDAIGLEVSNYVNAATNNIGIQVDDVVGGTAKRAIKTGLGPVEFGDDLKLDGSTSGILTLRPAAITTNHTETWPADNASGVLTNNGSGTLSWSAVGACATCITGTLNSGRIPIATGAQTVADDADLTFATDTLTATKIVGSTSITDSGLTSGRVTLAGTSGILTDDSDLTFATDTLTATKIIGSTSITDSGLTSGRVTFASTSGLLADDADLTFATDTLTATKILAPTQVTSGTMGGTTGLFKIAGTTSGVVTLTANDAAGTWTAKWPNSGGTAGNYLRTDGSGTMTWVGNVVDIAFIIDGGGAAITTGVKGDLEIPFGCTINANTVLLDQSGSIVIDIWKDTYANYPPTVADTITASAKPTVSSATKSQDTTLTGWTTTVTAGDTLRFNVDSATTTTRALLSLKCTKS